MKMSDYEVIEEEGGLLNDFQDEKIPIYRQPRTYLIVFIVVLVILAILVPLAIVYGNPDTLIRTIKTKNLMNHLQNLQDIANKNSGSRTATTGYNSSADYVYNKLNKYNKYFNIRIQDFNYNNFVEDEKPTFIVDGRSIEDKVYFQNMRFSGSGNLTNYPVHSVSVGCTDEDWETFPKDNTTIAVIGRNDLIECNVQTKINKAVENFAVGVIMYNAPGSNTLFQAGLTSLADFPIFAVGYDLGNEIASSNVLVTMTSKNSQNILTTKNIIADTKSGNKDHTIVIGSHLDSVLAGPGINDNGSGSSVNLEIALLFAKLAYKPVNRVRFCWFGAEELGLFGSLAYVNSLNQNELNEIALNLNFDMVASPNFIMGIYNGTSSSVQSGNIQKVFEKYFDENEIKFVLTPFTGRSDYGPFLEKGIPAGGLFTGAEQIKSVEEYKTFGGVAQVAYDPCYHLFCDTIDNINQYALLNNAKAAAYAVDFFAYNKDIKDYLDGKTSL